MGRLLEYYLLYRKIVYTIGIIILINYKYYAINSFNAKVAII